MRYNKIKLIKILFLSLCLLRSYLYATEESFNENGNLGYISLPSAFTQKESSLAYGFVRGEPVSKIYLNLSPFNWLDGVVYYVDISNKPYPGSGFRQSYKDKGFNLKVSYPAKILGHYLSAGLNDFAGTGIFASEYIVATKKNDRFEYSFGIGWGILSGGTSFRNPLIDLDNSFEVREKFRSGGGQFNFKNIFSGKKSGIFAASSYSVTRNLRIYAEYDSSIPNSKYTQEPFKSRFNFGMSINYNNSQIKTSFKRGEELSFELSSKLNFLEYKRNKKYYKKASSYSELQSILDSNNIGLESVKEDPDQLQISIKQNSYESQHVPSQIVLETIAQKLAKKKGIQISQSYLGMEVVRVFYSNSQKNAKNDSNNTQKVLEDSAESYRVIERYPIINNYIFPNVRTLLASREKFLHLGVLIENNTEIFLKDNIFVLSNLKYSVIDDFDNLFIEPLTTYPAQVRSDNKDYLREMSKGINIGRLEINYLSGFQNKHFLRLSAGIYEDMFGGVGVDYVYAPQDSNFSIGAEYYSLKKRDYSLNLSFQDFSNQIARFGIQYIEPKTKIRLKLSIGEYIAGDHGYTFQISRRFNNGIEFGGFFTRTDVSKKQFGEGSFDKGIYFKAPIRFPWSNLESTAINKYVWRPLTKDPGATLIKSIDLYDELVRYRVN